MDRRFVNISLSDHWMPWMLYEITSDILFTHLLQTYIFLPHIFSYLFIWFCLLQQNNWSEHKLSHPFLLPYFGKLIAPIYLSNVLCTWSSLFSLSYITITLYRDGNKRWACMIAGEVGKWIKYTWHLCLLSNDIAAETHNLSLCYITIVNVNVIILFDTEFGSNQNVGQIQHFLRKNPLLWNGPYIYIHHSVHLLQRTNIKSQLQYISRSISSLCSLERNNNVK